MTIIRISLLFKKIFLENSMRTNNREVILKTARQLFLKFGYNGISMRTIASEAGLTTGAVYFHFKNKMDIYKTICLEATDLLIEKFRSSVAAQEQPQNKLISTYDAFISFYNDNKEHYNLLMEYKSAYDSEQSGEKDEIAQSMKELMRIMTDTFREGIEKNVYRDIDPVLTSLLLASITEGMLQYKKMGIFDAVNVSDKQFRSFMADVIGFGLLKESNS